MIIRQNLNTQAPSFGAEFRMTDGAKEQLKASLQECYPKLAAKNNILFAEFTDGDADQFCRDLRNDVEDLTQGIEGEIKLRKGPDKLPIVTFAFPGGFVWVKPSKDKSHTTLSGEDLLPRKFKAGEKIKPQLKMLIAKASSLVNYNAPLSDKNASNIPYEVLRKNPVPISIEDVEACNNVQQELDIQQGVYNSELDKEEKEAQNPFHPLFETMQATKMMSET